MSLMSRMIDKSTLKHTNKLEESIVFEDGYVVPTNVPMVNVALSGKFSGGVMAGLTILAGPSKHFKSAFALLMAGAYLESDPEAILLFYDSEFGTPKTYFDTFNIDISRVVHTPITDIEELKTDLINQLSNIDRKDKVIIVVDSIGNLASKKEIDDAMDGKTVADMTRAKQLRSLFRMVTPHLSLKDIPLLAINHTYVTMEMFSKQVVSGGCVEAGTKIQTPQGMKAVEDFNVGDVVITLDGEKEVTHVWNPETLENGEPERFKVSFEDGYSVVCSPEHKFLIDGEWVEAQNLSIGSDVNSL